MMTISRVLAHHGSSVAHNPGSNLRLGSGVAPIRQMRTRGVALGIGTDGPHCSDNQNMFEAMRLAAMVSRIGSVDPQRWLSAEDALEMATEGGAHALGLEGQIGQIAPGYKADIVFLDLGHPNFVPLNDPTHQLVHTENGGAVDSVMIGGRLVLDHGRFPGMDFTALRHKVNERALALREANKETRLLLQQISGMVETYCVGLARHAHHVDRLLPGAGEAHEAHA